MVQLRRVTTTTSTNPIRLNDAEESATNNNNFNNNNCNNNNVNSNNVNNDNFNNVNNNNFNNNNFKNNNNLNNEEHNSDHTNNNNQDIHYISRDDDNSDTDDSSSDSNSDSSSDSSSDSNSDSSSNSSSGITDNKTHEDLIVIREEDDELVARSPSTSPESETDTNEPRRHEHFSCQTESTQTEGLGFRRYEEHITVSLTVFDPTIRTTDTTTTSNAVKDKPATPRRDDEIGIDALTDILPPVEDVMELLEPDEMEQILQLVANGLPPPTPGRTLPIRNFTGIEPLPDKILEIIRGSTGKLSLTKVVGNTRFRIRMNAGGEATVTTTK